MNDISIRPFAEADTEWVVGRHAELYARDEGFDGTFGPLVAGIIADFIETHDPAREGAWIAEQRGKRIGSIFCTRGKSPDRARLRLFLIVPEARGQGLGHKLLDTCMAFARTRDTGTWNFGLTKATGRPAHYIRNLAGSWWTVIQ